VGGQHNTGPVGDDDGKAYVEKNKPGNINFWPVDELS